MKQSWIFVPVLLMLASTAHSFEDCSTSELKAEALSTFLDRHYGPGFRMIGQALKEGRSYLQMPTDGREVEFEEDPELMNAVFSTMDNYDEVCEGVVRINDDCDFTTVDGLSHW